MARYAAIDCAEEHGTLTEKFDHDVGFTASVVLRCAWADRLALMIELLSPAAYPYPNTPLGWTPSYPIEVELVADETKYTTDSDEQVITYEHALLSVQYGYIDVTYHQPGKDPKDPEDPEEETRFTENLEASTQFLTQDEKNFRWSNIPVTEDADIDADELVVVDEGDIPGFQLPLVDLVRTYYNLGRIHGSLLTLYGSVNSEAYTSRLLGLTFPAETLLFMPPSLNRSFTTEGYQGWTLTLRFSYKQQGWNQFWRPETANWSPLIRWEEEKSFAGAAGTGHIYRPYPPRDFSYWLR